MKLHEIVTALIEDKITIATAESCTGGKIAAAMTDVPGASEIFGYGMVTYSNDAKIKILGVKAETLAAHGAVSPETAYEMAAGLKRVSGADVAVSVTGIAGPGGGSPEKPVGLVYMGIAYGDDVFVKKNFFQGERDEVRLQTVETALYFVAEKVLK